MKPVAINFAARQSKTRGCSSVVERHVANVNVEGSTPFTRSWSPVRAGRGFCCALIGSSQSRRISAGRELADVRPRRYRVARAVEVVTLREVATHRLEQGDLFTRFDALGNQLHPE